jgi:hypothetical protein
MAPGDEVGDPFIPVTAEDLKSLETTLSSSLATQMNISLAAQNNQIKELQDTMIKFMATFNNGATSTPSPAITPIKETPPTKVALNGADNLEKEVVDEVKSTKNSGTKDTHAVAPPLTYSPEPRLPHHHIVNLGPPPPLNPKDFERWQAKMKSYFLSSSIELWRIVQVGFTPFNPEELTRGELVESQLNASALWIIQQAVDDKEMPHIEYISTAKEAWQVLSDTFIGNENMKCNKYDEVSNEADGFIMEDGEDHKDMYRRLKALAKRFKKLGAEHADDAWVKRKYIQSLMHLEAHNL